MRLKFMEQQPLDPALMNCPHCQEAKRIGIHATKERRYKCHRCGQTVAGALKVEYRMKDGGAFALFLATTASVKLEIGLETRDVTATAKSAVDVLDRMCVTYQEGGTFASTPANIAANVQNT